MVVVDWAFWQKYKWIKKTKESNMFKKLWKVQIIEEKDIGEHIKRELLAKGKIKTKTKKVPVEPIRLW